jgi:Arc/MetJ-type ribon-helix-helix transcriptional regulator
MPKKFEVVIHVKLPKELADFLDGMVREGAAETVSQAVRKCVSIAKTYMPEIEIETKEKEG